jgi:hypothetical protein
MDNLNQIWWHMLVIPALQRLRQEVLKFEGSLGYLARPCLRSKILKRGRGAGRRCNSRDRVLAQHT